MLFAGAGDTEDWFSWTIEPPLTAAALGAFYWSALVLLATGARAPGWAAVRPVALPVLAIAVVLLVVTLIHLDRFHTDRLFGVFWVCAYVVAPPLLAFGIVVQRRAEAGDPVPSPGPRLPGPLRALIGAEAAAMLAASAVMLLAPDSAADLWPWALTPLTSRALGAFTLGVALVGVLVLAQDRLAIFRGTALAYAALGALQLLAVALHSGDLGDDDAANAVYLGFLAAVLLTGIYGLSASRALSRS